MSRLSPFSMLGLLAVLAVVAYLTIRMMGGGAGGGPQATGNSLGSYQNAVNAARTSAAQQDSAATTANATQP